MSKPYTLQRILAGILAVCLSSCVPQQSEKFVAGTYAFSPAEPPDMGAMVTPRILDMQQHTQPGAFNAHFIVRFLRQEHVEMKAIWEAADAPAYEFMFLQVKHDNGGPWPTPGDWVEGVLCTVGTTQNPGQWTWCQEHNQPSAFRFSGYALQGDRTAPPWGVRYWIDQYENGLSIHAYWDDRGEGWGPGEPPDGDYNDLWARVVIVPKTKIPNTKYTVTFVPPNIVEVR